MTSLSLIFGALVGLSLGLTGGGGAIFAVPLLVYGLGIAPRDAVGVSLAAVGATSLVGFLRRWRTGQVDVRTGLVFAAAGMLSAPVGSWLAGRMPDTLLLSLFAIVMVVVATRMWQPARQVTRPVELADSGAAPGAPTCARRADGRLNPTGRCVWLLALTGLVTGVLSGLFGVGGGFVIVPALVLVSGMEIHRAVATSLLVIALVSVSGVATHLWAGRTIAPQVAALFIAGGVAGLFVGQALGHRLSPVRLQKVFAVAILLVAMFVMIRSVGG